jgi:hypothetical protein
VVVLLLAAACAGRTERPPVTEVMLLGDSLAQEAAPYLQRHLREVPLVERHFGGTAPCDWLDDDLQPSPGGVVVISFSGNSMTPCMDDGAGGFLHGEALVDKYRLDLSRLIAKVRSPTTEVMLVGQPERSPAATVAVDAEMVAGINAVLSQLAGDDGVSFVDAGASVESRDGEFAATLPCLPGEAECDPSGSNVVRNDDGVHLCRGTAPDPCAEYSSGAYRFARAIADALELGAGSSPSSR